MFKIFKQKASAHWRSRWIVLGTVVLGLGLFNVAYAQATWWEELLGAGANIAAGGLYLILGAIIEGISFFVSGLITAITKILFSFAQYNSFVDNNVVLIGWPVVRDFCNMFFILILLVIAFATILRIENYGLKRLLPKLVIMAVLINFSKTICGLLIDFSQVIMLTLLGSFSNAGAGNLFEAFGIDKIYSIRATQEAVASLDISALTLFTSLMLGFVVLVITGIVIGIFAIILAFRIVAFWILIILSPLAFIASVLPGTSKYFGQWLSQFTNYLIIGPVMAFFLWLALATAGQVTFKDKLAEGLNQQSDSNEIQINAFLNEIGTPDNLIKFIVSTCLLLGGLMAAQSLGVAGGQLAGSALAKIQGAGIGAARKFTGYRWAAERVKGWQGMREALRKEKVGVGAAKLLALEGKLKGAPGRMLSYGLKGKAGREVDRRRAEAVRLRLEARNSFGEAKNLEKEGKLQEAKNKRKEAEEKEIKASSLDREIKQLEKEVKPSRVFKAASWMSRWGAREASHAVNYKSKEVGKKQDELKLDNDEEVKRKADSVILDPYERMAAILEGVKREVIDGSKIGEYRGVIDQLSRNNKPLLARYESEVERHYHAQALFSNEQKANYIKGGKWNLKDLGADAIRDLIKTVVESTKVGSFKKQYDDLPKARQQAVLDSLEDLIKQMKDKIPQGTDEYKFVEQNKVGYKDKTLSAQNMELYEAVERKHQAEERRAKVDGTGGLNGTYKTDKAGKVNFIKENNLAGDEAAKLLKKDDLGSKEVVKELTQSHIINLMSNGNNEQIEALANTMHDLYLKDEMAPNVKVMVEDKNNTIGKQLYDLMNLKSASFGSGSSTSNP